MERIGPRNAYQDLPELIYLHGDPYILAKSNDRGYELFTVVCPYNRARSIPMRRTPGFVPTMAGRSIATGRATPSGADTSNRIR